MLIITSTVTFTLTLSLSLAHDLPGRSEADSVRDVWSHSDVVVANGQVRLCRYGAARTIGESSGRLCAS